MSKKLIAILLAALLLTGLVAGCGGSGGGGDKTGGDAKEPVKEAEKVFVTIATGVLPGLTSHWVELLPTFGQTTLAVSTLQPRPQGHLWPM